MTRDEAVAKARAVAQQEGWAWVEPSQTTFRRAWSNLVLGVDMKCFPALLAVLLWLPACGRSNSTTHEPLGGASARSASESPRPNPAAGAALDHESPPSPSLTVPRGGASAASAAEHIEAFELGGLQLRLVEQSAACFILQEGHEQPPLELSLPPPCRLHRTAEGAVRVETPHGPPVALIESSSPHPQLPKDCDTRVQAVRVVQSHPSVSPHTSRVAACSPFHWDLKLFSGLFESPTGPP